MWRQECVLQLNTPFFQLRGALGSRASGARGDESVLLLQGGGIERVVNQSWSTNKNDKLVEETVLAHVGKLS